MGLFGKTQEKSPKDMVTEWTSKLRKENYALDRQVRGIQREEEKIKRSLKDAAKKGDKDVCVILAKEVLRARKAINKIQTTKAHINSVQLQMKNQLAHLKITGNMKLSSELLKSMINLVRIPEVATVAQDLSREMMKVKFSKLLLESRILESALSPTLEIPRPEEAVIIKRCGMIVIATLRVAGSLSKSTEVMSAMQNLLKLTDVSDTMRELSKEMMKAGIIEEMLEETFEGMEDQDEMEEEAQEQVDKILWEVTQGTLGKAPAAVTDKLPSAEPAAGTSYEENEEELDDMRSRLAALRS